MSLFLPLYLFQTWRLLTAFIVQTKTRASTPSLSTWVGTRHHSETGCFLPPISSVPHPVKTLSGSRTWLYLGPIISPQATHIQHGQAVNNLTKKLTFSTLCITFFFFFDICDSLPLKFSPFSRMFSYRLLFIYFYFLKRYLPLLLLFFNTQAFQESFVLLSSKLLYQFYLPSL